MAVGCPDEWNLHPLWRARAMQCVATWWLGGHCHSEMRRIERKQLLQGKLSPDTAIAQRSSRNAVRQWA